MAVSEQQVLDALRSVIDPDLNADIVRLGFVKDIVIEGGRVSFKVELTTPACPVKEILEQQAREAVSGIEGVDEVELEMTSRVRDRKIRKEDRVPSVRQIVAIASGKGGVGKSTVTVNLAIALSNQGARVGILDADIYGPSIPLMMGVKNERPMTRDAKIVPIERFGIKMMSIGFLLEEGQAVLWRGPMIHKTLEQLFADVSWGELDYLLIDLPPGTGDAPMSIGQLVSLSGVVLVTTPHNVAANIAGKAAALFTKLETPLLGVVENMAGFACPTCGEMTRLFAGMTGQELATELGIPYLGSIPLVPEVSAAADKGMPSLVASPDSPQATAFKEVAGALAARLSIAAESQDAAGAEPAVP